MNNEAKGLPSLLLRKLWVVSCLRGEEAIENGDVWKGLQEPAGCRHESPSFAGRIGVLPLGVKLFQQLRWDVLGWVPKATRIT